MPVGPTLRRMTSVAAGVAASHPATAEAGLRILRDGGTAADAAVAAVLACCVAETIYTGLGGGGFATYFDAATREVTCLDFFVAVPGTDGDHKAGPMIAVDVLFGGLPQVYSIGGASVAVPGVPAGCGEVHRRWGRLPWAAVVAPAIELAAAGVPVPEAHARTLDACAPALAWGEGAAGLHPRRAPTARRRPAVPSRPRGRAGTVVRRGSGRLLHRGVRAVAGRLRAGGGRLRSARATWPTTGCSRCRWTRHALDGYQVRARHDLNRTVDTIADLPADLSRPARAVGLASALRDQGPAEDRRHHERVGGRRRRATPA